MSRRTQGNSRTFRQSRERRPDKVLPSHLERLAVVYVRQSTPQQVERHQESRLLQYRLKERALDLGWREDRILVVDDDLGRSAATTEGRDGFKSLVGEVTLGHVGVILGVEFDRLARSGGATYQLLDACGIFDTLIADPGYVYDPTDFNDRMLLGLKGTMGEAELHLIKRRMHGAKLEKARRGELGFRLPRGYVRRPSGEIVKDPDEQVRQVVDLVLSKFAELGTLSALLRYLAESGVRLGHRIASGPAKGDLTWTRPNRPTLQNLLTNPAYAGAYAYGRRKTDRRKKQAGRPNTGRVTQAMEEWHVLIRDHHPAYISWEQYEANRARLRANSNVFHATGLARKGAGLFAGLLHCGKCGATMFVQYTGREAAPSYTCQRQTIDYGAPFCQHVSARHLEPFLVDEVLRLLCPANLELSLRAAGDVQAERDRLHGLWEKRLERAKYGVDRAERSYRLVEPENRLVIRQLERDWEESLLEQKKLEEEYDRFCRDRPRLLTAEEQKTVRGLASDIPALWHSSQTTNADRKEILRVLLDRVVVGVVGESEKVDVEIHWAGGDVVKGQVVRPVARYEQLSYYPDLRQRIAELRKQGSTYAAIAERLNEEGYRPPKRKDHFGPLEVGAIVRKEDLGRGRYGGGCRFPGNLRENEWLLADLARELDMPKVTLHSWVRRGRVQATCRQEPRPHWVVTADEPELARLRTLREESQAARAHARWMAASDAQMSES